MITDCTLVIQRTVNWPTAGNNATNPRLPYRTKRYFDYQRNYNLNIQFFFLTCNGVMRRWTEFPDIHASFSALFCRENQLNSIAGS